MASDFGIKEFHMGDLGQLRNNLVGSFIDCRFQSHRCLRNGVDGIVQFLDPFPSDISPFDVPDLEK